MGGEECYRHAVANRVLRAVIPYLASTAPSRLNPAQLERQRSFEVTVSRRIEGSCEEQRGGRNLVYDLQICAVRVRVQTCGAGSGRSRRRLARILQFTGDPLMLRTGQHLVWPAETCARLPSRPLLSDGWQ